MQRLAVECRRCGYGVLVGDLVDIVAMNQVVGLAHDLHLGVGRVASDQAQGAAEADKNAADATAYGIGPGSTIWYDLEGFNLGDTHCRESALVFTSSWVTRIKALGYVAGFYSSASSGIKMLDDARRLRPGQFALPDRIWIARWDGVANTSTTYIPEDGWRPGGRMKQYRGGHNETWGGVTINIDSNFIDLGAGSVPRPEGRCPGTRLGFWKYPALSPGSAKTTRVKVLQCLLTEQGTYSGPINGAYDAATIAGARAWQAARRFTPTDTFAKRHWVALLSAGAEYRLASNVSFGAKFDGEFASNSQTYSGTGTVRYTW